MQQTVAGEEVPKDLTVPFLKITQDVMDASLTTTPGGSVANVCSSLEDTQVVIAEAK